MPSAPFACSMALGTGDRVYLACGALSPPVRREVSSGQSSFVLQLRQRRARDGTRPNENSSSNGCDSANSCRKNFLPHRGHSEALIQDPTASPMTIPMLNIDQNK